MLILGLYLIYNWKGIVYRDIFKAIHEGKWLSIEYKNKNDQITIMSTKIKI